MTSLNFSVSFIVVVVVLLGLVFYRPAAGCRAIYQDAQFGNALSTPMMLDCSLQ